MSGKLKTYESRRNFAATPEPKGKQTRTKAGKPLRYLIQRHAATRLHYDFRIEHHGVLKSWAVTKAPSRDPTVKRLAVEVEDHPIDYGTFEGTIPEGSYGAGTVQLWDRGRWTPQDADFDEAMKKGVIKLELDGERLRGGWALVRLKSDRGRPSKRNNWLLIKEKDAHAVAGEGDALAEIDASVSTGRSLAEIAQGKRQLISSKPPAAATQQTTTKLPAFVPIQLCKIAAHPPGAVGWAHEIKFDGYRIEVGVRSGRATLRTRKGLDWSDRFPELSAEAAAWPDAVIDGELCALDADHRPDFSALQAAIGDRKTGGLIYFAFDLLFEGREDLRKLPLSHRKARLQAYVDHVSKAGPHLRYVEHFGTSGQAVLESACRMDLEGIISKKLDAPYHAGRSASWLKSKCRGRDDVVIGGWSSEGGVRFRSLLVGVRKGDGLRYLGRVGTGYSAALTKTLLPALKAATAAKNPFMGPGTPKAARDIHWVRPILVAEIEHGGYTEAGSLRQGAYKGLREDKSPAEVTDAPQAPTANTSKVAKAAAALTASAVTRGPAIISNPDKVLWPAHDDHPAITKADLARYYERAADRILPHVADRPTSIIRAPDGIEGERFFQRHAMPGSNPRLKLIDVKERKPYVAAVDAGGLVAIGQSGGLELHPWGCKPGDPETPDQITFDLDPDEGLDFADVIAGAKAVKAKLETLGLPPFIKTTGGKGLHVVVPIAADARRKVTWDQAKAFAKAVSEAVCADAPDRFTTTLAKKARGGKIFLDYLRNGRMATAVAPWSPRARPGAGIAFPLSWGQVKAGLDPSAFNLHTAAALLKKPDPWTDFRKAEVPLRPALKAMGLKD